VTRAMGRTPEVVMCRASNMSFHAGQGTRAGDGLLVFIVFVLLFRTYDAREMLAMKQ
jgi:hypothetical protein